MKTKKLITKEYCEIRLYRLATAIRKNYPEMAAEIDCLIDEGYNLAWIKINHVYKSKSERAEK